MLLCGGTFEPDAMYQRAIIQPFCLHDGTQAGRRQDNDLGAIDSGLWRRTGRLDPVLFRYVLGECGAAVLIAARDGDVPDASNCKRSSNMRACLPTSADHGHRSGRLRCDGVDRDAANCAHAQDAEFEAYGQPFQRPGRHVPHCHNLVIEVLGETRIVRPHAAHPAVAANREDKFGTLGKLDPVSRRRHCSG